MHVPRDKYWLASSNIAQLLYGKVKDAHMTFHMRTIHNEMTISFKLEQPHCTTFELLLQKLCLCVDYRDYVYGIWNGCMPPTVVQWGLIETLLWILSAHKHLVKSHLSKTFDKSVDDMSSNSQSKTGSVLFLRYHSSVWSFCLFFKQKRGAHGMSLFVEVASLG